jgi:hypothetical protein
MRHATVAMMETCRLSDFGTCYWDNIEHEPQRDADYQHRPGNLRQGPLRIQVKPTDYPS